MIESIFPGPDAFGGAWKDKVRLSAETLMAAAVATCPGKVMSGLNSFFGSRLAGLNRSSGLVSVTFTAAPMAGVAVEKATSTVSTRGEVSEIVVNGASTTP